MDGTHWLRDAVGLDWLVDETSGAYIAGIFVGIGIDIAIAVISGGTCASGTLIRVARAIHRLQIIIGVAQVIRHWAQGTLSWEHALYVLPLAGAVIGRVGRALGKWGCFVSGTLVLTQPELGTQSSTGAALVEKEVDWSLPAVLVGVGMVGSTALAGKRRRRRKEDLVDEVLAEWNASDDNDRYREDDPTQSIPEDETSTCCNERLFADEVDWGYPLPLVDPKPASLPINDTSDWPTVTLVRTKPPGHCERRRARPSVSPELANTKRVKPARAEPDTSRRFGLSALWLAACLLLAGLAAWRNSPPPNATSGASIASAGVAVATPDLMLAVPQPLPAPIETIRVGQAVLASNPTDEEDLDFGDEVDQATWKHLILRAPKDDGSWCDIELLRPDWWVAESDAERGVVYVAVPECGIDGEATVVAIKPCPAVQPPAPGYRSVTGTFRHSNVQVVDLDVEGVATPIGTTPNHLFWSEDRLEFVRADELVPGETLLALDREVQFLGRKVREECTSVYNLEVHVDHVYHVTTDGLLVHNNAELCKGLIWVKESADGRLGWAKFQAGATNARKGFAPALRYKPGKLGTRKYVKFDGVTWKKVGDKRIRIMVDRKRNIRFTQKFQQAAKRQSKALSDNKARGRWEVPNSEVKDQADDLLRKLKIKNITVVVVK
jgi:hypothetical protein